MGAGASCMPCPRVTWGGQEYHKKGNLAPRHPALSWSLTNALLPAPSPRSPALISLGPAGIALSHLVQPGRA